METLLKTLFESIIPESYKEILKNIGKEEILDQILKENDEIDMILTLKFYQNYDLHDVFKRYEFLFEAKEEIFIYNIILSKRRFLLKICWKHMEVKIEYNKQKDSLEIFQAYLVGKEYLLHGLNFNSQMTRYNYGIKEEEMILGEKRRILLITDKQQSLQSVRSYLLSKKYYYRWISISSKPPFGKLYLYDYEKFHI